MKLYSLLVWGLVAPLQPTGEPLVGSTAVEASSLVQETRIPWTAETVEHLFNRAGFGARPKEIERALRMAPEEVVENLLKGGRFVEPPYYEQGSMQDYDLPEGVSRQEQRRAKAIRSKNDRAQLKLYTEWWIDRMVEGDDPLRDRMTLFWHGLFATAHSTVKRSYDMIEQHRKLRKGALGNYGELLNGIVKDPAMILYLDNDKNKKSAPNENLARELMELFSLGEGQYTEQDIKEVARALTGEFRDKLGNYRFSKKDHDGGTKVILGERGKFKAREVVGILLRQTACSRYIAGRLLIYFEGVKPDELRLTEYAGFLARSKYELKPFLNKLLLDPRFYREEALAARVASPVDYFVGSTRRLDLDLDSQFLYLAAADLGQELFDPPSVKGWDEGEAWIHTGSLLGRGNTMGLMLGTIHLEDTFLPLGEEVDPLAERGPARKPEPRGSREASMEDDMQDSMEDSMGDSMGETMEDGDSMQSTSEAMATRTKIPKEFAELVRALGKSYRPSLNLSHRLNRAKIATDLQVVEVMLDSLLAITPPADTHQRVLTYFTGERVAAGLTEDAFLSQPEVAEDILRRLAHLILSLPEAQLL